MFQKVVNVYSSVDKDIGLSNSLLGEFRSSIGWSLILYADIGPAYSMQSRYTEFTERINLGFTVEYVWVETETSWYSFIGGQTFYIIHGRNTFALSTKTFLLNHEFLLVYEPLRLVDNLVSL